MLFSLLLCAGVVSATHSDLLRMGAQGVNLWKLEKSIAQAAPNLVARADEFPEQWFVQPLDHFAKTGTNQTQFKQRYWVNKRHYKEGNGGPVIVLDGGETSGEDRIPFLDTGIVEILAKATGGVGVVLEHRYYGTSIPVANFSTDNLRWLNNDQAAADSANFMANVKFEGILEDLTAPSTPWIYYGGSYAGARAAHMKILYPDLVFGSIASSGVTHAALSNWEYFDVIRKAANPTCSRHLEKSVEYIDLVLATKILAKPLKSLFGLEELHDDDFTTAISYPLGSWQSKNWDPAVGSNEFDKFCAALNAPPFGASSKVVTLPFNSTERQVKTINGLSLDFSLLNYAKYIKNTTVANCNKSGQTVTQCFGTYDDSAYQGVGLEEDWRLWIFQVCTEWGYFTTAPPDPKYPRIISRLQTLPYLSKICKQAYPPGKYMTVPNQPNVTAVNVLGDFAIAADRLAIIDGAVDPWRPDTPHSEWYAKDRKDTILRPFKLIPGAVHHWDENGLKNMADEPAEILKIHGEMIVFVTEWLKDWAPPIKSISAADRKNAGVYFKKAL